ncbi:hypothetical protein GCM10010399_75610 [Dactylosporangium fulvum]|uniref:Uncharacterized protein n=1 Tax=Dactylosporangium fulvum TaxID=53359 RepID=A0ABY5VPS8_9ACTN|nr:hypothetical protein [Dactylosporangium fulvum]UWP79182.1 hypothetical protein Dfulv_28895 [Dactylosporangium fulvum]
MVAVVIAGVAAVSVWRVRAARQPRPGDTISLRDGRVTFRMPQGWRRVACPGDPSGCVFLRTPRGADDAIAVIVVTPRPPAPEADATAYAIDPATSPGGRSFTVDGARFARARVDAVTIPTARPATTVVTGLLHNGDKVFLTCAETAEPDLIRAGCEVIIGSLHVQR